MGYTYEVTVWTVIAGIWKEKQVYAGESLRLSFLAMHRAKRDGHKCIRMHWRPSGE